MNKSELKEAISDLPCTLTNVDGKQEYVGISMVSVLKLIDQFEEPELNDSQLWHLKRLTTHYESLKENQPYPIYYGLFEYMQGDEGPDLEDSEYGQVIQTFLNKVLVEEATE